MKYVSYKSHYILLLCQQKDTKEKLDIFKISRKTQSAIVERKRERDREETAAHHQQTDVLLAAVYHQQVAQKQH